MCLLKKILIAVQIASTALAWSQTTGSGLTVLENGSTINPKVLAQVRYADQYPGDLGAQINAAVIDLGGGGGVVKIRSGNGTSYTWSTPVVIDPRIISIVGDGASLVRINCAATKCLMLDEGNLFNINQGGAISGFMLAGNGSSEQVGIEAGGIQGELFDDIILSNFNGNRAVGLLFNNSGTANGWMERTVTHRLRFDNDTTGWEFNYNAANSAAGSFGYSDLQAQCDTVKSGQTCIFISSGQLYHSRIHFLGNVNSGGTFIAVGATGAVWANTYAVFAEGKGTGLSVANGGQFYGSGFLDFRDGLTVVNNNAPHFRPTLRLAQTPVGGDSGSFTNFLGTGVTTTIYPQIVSDIGSPYAGFGFLLGQGGPVYSTYVSMYSGQGNAFDVLACPWAPSSLSACGTVARIDSGGNVHATGSYYANGQYNAESIHVAGGPTLYEPGDVLSIDTSANDRFTKSSEAYSTTVAGIYSTKPGVLGSNHALDPASFKDEVPLAINGIVPCKVTAENGPISPGDLLVASSTPGYAMKATDRSRMIGAVIGKALAPHASGRGTIKVLLTLQ